MSTDIEPQYGVLPTSTDLTKFAEEASQVHAIAKALAQTSFVPKAFQGKPDEITGAILFGRALNLDPMVALQMIVPIEGRPSMYANAMRGLAQAHGVKFKVINSSNTRVTMAAVAPGDTEWTTVEWPIERAKQMGLTGKSNWVKMPQAMLIARATSELCRLVASNVLLGLPYSVEELGDMPYEDARTANGEHAATPSPTPRKTMRRAPVQATVAEPEPEPYVPPDDREEQIARELEALPAAEDRGVVSIDVNVRKALMAKFNDAGIRSRDDRLALVSGVLGREVHSVNQLTTAEGKQVLAHLDDTTAGAWPDTREPAQ